MQIEKISCPQSLSYDGGKIWVESSKGSGPVFKFQIPALKN
jgi:hypothetical protein